MKVFTPHPSPDALSFLSFREMSSTRAESHAELRSVGMQEVVDPQSEIEQVCRGAVCREIGGSGVGLFG